MDRDIKKIISQMTLEEKAGMCSGLDFWHTKGVERLGIPSIMVTDGPHGLRKQAGESDHLGLNKSVPATCFPSGATLSCSWDKSLLKKVGVALGEECQAEDVSIILGPAANIKRSPLCGRNFEYFSEDPYLSSEMATNHIKGVQSQGVGTSLKHFAVNNQEHRRLSVNSVLDERALREIYLASFEVAVKESQPWTVMCAYNKVNGEYCSENESLLTSILKKEWGHEGFVMSDWGAVNERVSGLIAGLELEMPSSNGLSDRKIVEGVKNKSLPENILNSAVERLLKVVFKAVDNKKKNSVYDKEKHHKLARQVARECMVLLKNEENILPLKKEGNIAIIGAFAKNPRYQGGGSSHINPTKLDNVLEEIEESAGTNCNISYSEGFSLIKDDIYESLVDQAKKAASKSQVAVIFAGLPDRYESEGYDRTHMRIPENQINLIEEIAKVQKNIVVVLSNGSPIEMPWLNKVKGVLEGYIGGQAAGGAIADLLFGSFSPCGKLAETFPQKLSDNPSYLNFPGEGDVVEYKEGLFVGYRYYGKKELPTLFPFGHGLSYTNFEYSDITVDKKEMVDNETLSIKVKIKNTGKVTGKEIVQLYIKDVESTVIRPEKELRGFEKVELKPGQEKIITFTLGKRAFAYYNVEIKDWHVESGDFEILVGASSNDIKIKEVVNVKSTVVIKKKFSKNSTLGDIMNDPTGADMAESLIKDILGEGDNSTDDIGTDMRTMLKDFVLRSMITFSGGKFTQEMMESLVEKLNEN
ncbi:glycoside hydrolase family 3 C-terminal domain-containing protein [Clostridium estertheticum]|uniref:beta-glucosidase n=1 Tax=Clostridium estertheticum TaxID=238834 RepID=UPI001CF1BAC8|nr:glycoside hydrolase family 3 C-terminal domain-containing protein [Clostridium estertheticum]MCB2305582.1 glycoside hydrolase family 3 C-terminal domain-containing protein [Clostridium estertheticum]MCB2344021.1 glycoside hydrolase family 3 C-terminal domain-containing protein [Clostridium estertheticum]MCB2348937.1 glycoside hydrolase family 3 C-terminal domain-containing protein [Clostridium estertheticum]WAG46252.1 glycoside hydrolase family 3 C-terminal domain-containing protein [Clostri